MTFTEWMKLREGLNDQTVIAPNNLNVGTTSKPFYPNRNRPAPRPVPLTPHSNPAIRFAVDKLALVKKDIDTVVKTVNDSGYFEEHPGFKDAFLTRMRDAADGTGRAHAILSADATWNTERP